MLFLLNVVCSVIMKNTDNKAMSERGIFIDNWKKSFILHKANC